LEEAAQQITDKISLSGANKIKRFGAKIFNKYRELRFNNNPTALIFRSFDQAKEQRFHFKINYLKLTTNNFIHKYYLPIQNYPLALG
jgi:hypothetical protein